MNKLKKYLLSNLDIFKIIAIYIICLIFIIYSVILRLPNNNTFNFKSADASYHVLLTVKAFDSNPKRIHKFLPIVTLGNNYDKYISWGGTVMDKSGNFYYSSFYSIGFIVPYLYFKLTGLEQSIQNLFILNSLVLIISWLLLTNLLLKIFTNLNKRYLIIISTLIYAFQPEVIHSQGIAYWHHSLFQVIFLIQLNLFISLKGRFLHAIFLLACIIAPLIEWTGIISNLVFATVYFFNKAYIFKSSIFNITKNVILYFMGLISTNIIAIFIIFIHFTSVIDFNTIIGKIYSRLSSRALEEGSLYSLVEGYFQSYGLLLYFLVILGIISIYLIKYDKDFNRLFIENFLKKVSLLLICFIPLIENLIFKGHAIYYSFDRLKAILFLVVLFFLFLENFVKRYSQEKIYLIFTLILFFSSLNNLIFYQFYDNSYKWKVNYFKSNNKLVQYLNETYNPKDTLVLFENASVRGYLNLLFNKSLYEYTNIAQGIEIAKANNKRYVIVFNIPEGDKAIIYNLRFYKVYDIKNNRVIEENGNVLFSRHSIKVSNDSFLKILQKTKTIEPRLYSEKMRNIKLNDEIEFINEFTNEKILTTVTSIHKFQYFQSMFDDLGATSFGFSYSDPFFNQFLNASSLEKQKNLGVVGIKFRLKN